MELNSKSRIFGYARVSTGEQSDDLQVKALRAAGVPPSRIYSEVMSGARWDRKQLKLLLSQLRPRDVVLVWKLDRLGRSTVGILDTVQRIADLGATFSVITQPELNSATAAGKLMLTILSAVAEMERSLLKERTSAGIAAAKARGAKIGCSPKLPDDKIREIIGKIRADGISAYAAAKEYGMSPTGMRLRIRRFMEHNPDV